MTSVQALAKEGTRASRASRKAVLSTFLLGLLFTFYVGLSVVNVFLHPEEPETWVVAMVFSSAMGCLTFYGWLRHVPGRWFQFRRVPGAGKRAWFLFSGCILGIFAFIFSWAVVVTQPVGLLGVAFVVLGVYAALAQPVFWHRWAMLGGVVLSLAVIVVFSPYAMLAGPLAAATAWLVDAATGFHGLAYVRKEVAPRAARAAARRKSKPKK